MQLRPVSVYHPIDRKRYNWGSAPVPLSRDVVLRARPRLPLADCYLDPPTGDQLHAPPLPGEATWKSR